MPLKRIRRQSPRLTVNAHARSAAGGFGFARRRLLLAGLTGMAASLAFVGSAQAGGISVNQSAITSPADPYFVLDQNQSQTVTIAGTTNADTTDNVDIDCYHDDGSSGTEILTVASNVDATGGTFSTTVPISALKLFGNSQLCRLRAVDSEGAPPTTGLGAFTGPRTAYSYLNLSGNYDFYLFEQQLTSADDYLSLGGCGLDESYSDDATGAYVGHGFYCNDWTPSQSQTDASKSGITVDGEPAYDPDMARYLNSSAAGIPTLTVDSVTQDPSNGDLTLVDTEQFSFCQGDPTPPANGCATFIPAGVQDTRTFTQTDDGHVVTVHDVFSSTDAGAHSVDLLLENDQAFGTTSGDNDQDYLFPGQSSWVQTTGGESENLPAGNIGTTYVRNVNVPLGSAEDPLGAITYFQVPSGPLVFATGSSGNEDFDAPANLAVPASGSATLDYAYAADTTVDALNSDVASSKDAVDPPTVAITAPADGATLSSNPVTVSGTASAGSGVQHLTVDGSPVTVANDGSWTTSLTPVGGAQTITVTVSSQAGNTASSHETITYKPTTTATTSPPASPVGVDQTTAGRRVRSRFAVLSGSIAAHSDAVTYRFQYGATSTYGQSTRSRTLPAATGAVAVGIAARRLVPGSSYHYRLAVTDGAGRVSYGQDMVVRTPRMKARRVRDHITAYWAQQAPYGYVVDGRLVLARGLSKRVGCKTGGIATVTVTRGGQTIAQHRVTVTAHCTYHTALRFAAAKLPGSGRLEFHMQFAGNRQLRGRSARTLNVLYGPRNVTR